MVFLQQSIDSNQQKQWHVFQDEGYPVEPIEDFLRARIVAPSTQEYNARHLYYLWRFLDELELDWFDLRPSDRTQFLSWYSNTRKIESGDYLSKQSLELANASICAFLDFWKRQNRLTIEASAAHSAGIKTTRGSLLEGHIRNNRSNGNHRRAFRSKVNTVPKVVSEEQFALLMQAISNPTLKLMVFLARYLGPRKAELLGFRHEDIHDNQKRLLHIVARDDPARPKVRAKGASRYLDVEEVLDGRQVVDRIIPMTWLLQFQGVFNTYLELRDDYLSRIYKFLRKDPHLPYFVNIRNGRPLSYSYFYNMLMRECAKLNFTVTPHQLRHTFATSLLKRLYQANPEELFFETRTYKDRIGTAQLLQEWLGHSSIQTTLEIYCHFFDAIDMGDYMEQLNDQRYDHLVS
ncbi:tyrosine-type recombinase/integrase [Oscillatoria sp. FACHB-1407]|uniref:tyrosine-type recombinase/integrase n=1 Tax=Oscillatoria sp. FACHB-1407 TaxID=2692847 RepID=UPI001681C7AE|nr:tyrosine-type recombinase/integrase [Oscillatoria sp. FACHB-1407]MBD2463916.1 tyrosine-type recombinase/integrase [Oscillatoria sp. FACHB-1407]